MSSVRAQNSFEKFIPGYYDLNYGDDVIQTSDSGFVICGTNGEYYGQWPMFALTLTKTNSYGVVEWFHQFGLSFFNNGTAVQQTNDGSLIACGDAWIDTMSQALFVKTNQDGLLEFQRSYAVAGLNTYAVSVSQCPDSGFILCGTAGQFDPQFACMIRTDSQGDTLWTRTYRDSINEQGVSAICMPDGGYVLLSRGLETTTFMRHLDAQGNTLWVNKYSSLLARAFSMTTDSGFIISGTLYTDPYNPFGLLRTNSEGDSLWLWMYGLHMTPGSVWMLPDSGYIVGGTLFDSPVVGSRQLLLLRTDANGDPVWTMNWGGSEQDHGYAVKPTMDNGFIFVGTSIKPGTDSLMAYLIKTIEDSTTTSIAGSGESAKRYLVYPNPACIKLMIRSLDPQDEPAISLYDLNGNQVKSCIMRSQYTIDLDVSTLRKGVYILKIISQDKVECHKVMIE